MDMGQILLKNSFGKVFFKFLRKLQMKICIWAAILKWQKLILFVYKYIPHLRTNGAAISCVKLGENMLVNNQIGKRGLAYLNHFPK